MRKVSELLYRVFIISWVCWASYLLIQIKASNEDTALRNQISEMKQNLSDLAFDISVLQSKGNETKTAIINLEKNLATIDSRTRNIQKQVGGSTDSPSLRDMVEERLKD